MARSFVTRVLFAGFASLVGAFFALPLLWLLFAPFDETPTLAAEVPRPPTLQNFADVFDNPQVLRSLANSLLLVGGVVGLVLAVGAPASYVLSRIRFAGRDLFLYMLLLLSSVITGAAALVPIFLLIFELNLIDTFLGVILALSAGVLPAAIFILKDFTDTIPRSYEESARVFGASTLQTLRDVVFPMVRPGLAVIAVWTAVQVWGYFLLPFILLRTPSKSPAAVLMYSFYTEGGQPNLRLISAFSLLYTVPILVLYAFVNKRYGFRFHGGIKR